MTDERIDASTDDMERIPPLNLTGEEASYLWEMMMREVGKEEVQRSDDREVVESLHTKVRRITHPEDTDTEQSDEVTR